MILSITELKAYLNSFNLLLLDITVADKDDDDAAFDTCCSLDVLDLKLILTLLRDLAKYLTIMAVSMDRIINGIREASANMIIGNTIDEVPQVDIFSFSMFVT